MTIRLSLAVASTAQADPGKFLSALAADGILDDPAIETRIAHAGPRPAGDVMSRQRVIWLAQPKATGVFQLWGIAMAAAQGRWIAVLDAAAPPMPGWSAAAWREIERGRPVFFGPVEPGFGARDARVVGYLAEYAQFKRPLSPALAEVPGNNVVIRRDLLPSAQALARQGFFKTFTIWRLERAGGKAKPCAEMAVCHQKPFALRRYALRRLAHGRCFGAMRHREPGQPPKLLCIAFTPLLPVVRCARIYRAARRDRTLRHAFLRQLPRLLLSETAWSLGELLGYLRGDGGVCARLD